MSNKKTRRKWTASQKLKIVLETLQSDRQLATICRREGVSPNLVYQWRKQLLGSPQAHTLELDGISDHGHEPVTAVVRDFPKLVLDLTQILIYRTESRNLPVILAE